MRCYFEEKPFIKIDCASLPENLLESELFGYEKGAFTGATARKLGRVELADGGTLFLDEVGELTLPTQAKLLRLLQDQEFERLGGTKTIKVQLRVLAATHRDLEAMTEQSLFRQDLFYRLNVVPLWLPPLRARRGDAAALAIHFYQRAAARNQRSVSLSERAVRALSRERWPGNVRQLQNFIERLVVPAPGSVVEEADVRVELDRPAQFATDLDRSRSAVSSELASELTAEPAQQPPPPDEASLSEKTVPSPAVASIPESDHRLSQIVRDAERLALIQTLQRCGGNRSQAARTLGVSRSTFYSKMKQYGLL